MNRGPAMNKKLGGDMKNVNEGHAGPEEIGGATITRITRTIEYEDLEQYRNAIEDLNRISDREIGRVLSSSSEHQTGLLSSS